MKLNCNYCLIGILVLLLLYCCLGKNLLEGLSNNADKSVAEQVQSEGAKHASDEYKQYQEELGDEGLPQDQNFHDSNISGNKKYEPLSGGTYNKEDACDTGYVWNSATSKCVNDNKQSASPSASPSASVFPSPTPSSSNFDNLTSSIKGYGSDVSSGLNSASKDDSSGLNSASNDVSSGLKSISSDIGNLFSSNSSSQQPVQHSAQQSSGQQPSGQHLGSYPPSAPAVPGSQIPPGQKDQYILKSQIVPPVCPACPPQLSCPSKAKCPACPAPEPVQPCPPCARCPESPFTCKKVPDYTSPSVGGVLPRPMLNDFSQF